MKFRRTPLLQGLLDLRQFWQSGVPSSHFKCLSLQVKHPVLTRLGLDAAASAGALVAVACDGSLCLISTLLFSAMPDEGCSTLILLADLTLASLL